VVLRAGWALTREEMDLGQIGEFGLLQRIRRWAGKTSSRVVQGIGDDVAVMETKGRSRFCLLATTDMLVEDVDFRRSWADPYRLGKKALAVNLSDIAAMGGRPLYFLISLGLPRDIPVSFVSSFYRGLREGGRRHKTLLVGGDLTLSRKIVINICLIGEGRRDLLVYRKGARPGDDLFVSGTLGDAALGLMILFRKGPHGEGRRLINRHLNPTPRLELGQALSQKRLVSAMIDVSDGLLLDLSHLLEASQVGAQVLEGSLPLSKLYRRYIHSYSDDFYALALRGGEDYELLFTASAKNRERILSLSKDLKTPITWIGKILPPKEGLRILRKDGTSYVPRSRGYEHFTRLLHHGTPESTDGSREGHKG